MPPLLLLLASIACVLALSAAPVSVALAADPEPTEEATDADGQAPVASHPGYVQIKEISLPIFSDGGVDRVYEMDLAIEVVTPGAAVDALRQEPRVRDAVYTSLYARIQTDSTMTRQGMLDIRRVRAAVYSAVVDILGQDVVTNVQVMRINQFALY